MARLQIALHGARRPHRPSSPAHPLLVNTVYAVAPGWSDEHYAQVIAATSTVLPRRSRGIDRGKGMVSSGPVISERPMSNRAGRALQETCTINDVCQQDGTCTGTSLECSSLDTQCTQGVCVGGTCQSQNINEGQACDGGVCNGGTCAPTCLQNGSACTSSTKDQCCSGYCFGIGEIVGWCTSW